jgi:hypothetical protein
VRICIFVHLYTAALYRHFISKTNGDLANSREGVHEKPEKSLVSPAEMMSIRIIVAKDGLVGLGNEVPERKPTRAITTRGTCRVKEKNLHTRVLAISDNLV